MSAGRSRASAFTKGAGNSGTHTGLLYSAAGRLLAQAVFTGETTSGWQQVNFSSPVAISANSTYVAAYHSTTGYAYDSSYFTNSGFDNAPLHALRSGVDGLNGVYAYGASPAFPGNSSGDANYWADVVFAAGQTTPIPTVPDLTVAKTHTGNFTQGQTGVTYTVTVTNAGGASTSGTVTLNETIPTGLMATAIAGTGWNCTQPAGPCTRSDGLNPGTSYPPITITVNVSRSAAASMTNTATVSGGGETNIANNQASDATTVSSSSGFNTASFFAPSTVPGTPFKSDTAVTLGTRFRANVSGSVTAIRFYKGEGSTGAHIGLLYNESGNVLAQATFTNETASGWQQVNLASPVVIAAGLQYTAAYFSTTGYAYDPHYFAISGLDNGPLHIFGPSEGNGLNGVYQYGGAPAFPTNGSLHPNYWVDVVFSYSGSATSQPRLAPVHFAKIGMNPVDSEPSKRSSQQAILEKHPVVGRRRGWACAVTSHAKSQGQVHGMPTSWWSLDRTAHAGRSGTISARKEWRQQFRSFVRVARAELDAIRRELKAASPKRRDSI
jgi:uncharacterized repeat protein (TIGR01451 family)